MSANARPRVPLEPRSLALVGVDYALRLELENLIAEIIGLQAGITYLQEMYASRPPTADRWAALRTDLQDLAVDASNTLDKAGYCHGLNEKRGRAGAPTPVQEVRSA